MKDFAPEAVVSDFDSFAYLYAKRHGLPILSIDNQQIISRTKLDPEVKKGQRVDYQLTKAFIRAKLPGCDHYLVTTFFRPPIRKKYQGDTELVPPILRKTILDSKKKAHFGDHVIVYQTSTSDKELIPALNSIGSEKFIIYGLRKNAVHDNRTLKDFSEVGFIKIGVGESGRCERRAVADRRSTLPRKTDLQRAGPKPVRANPERALPRDPRLRPRSAESRLAVAPFVSGRARSLRIARGEAQTARQRRAARVGGPRDETLREKSQKAPPSPGDRVLLRDRVIAGVRSRPVDRLRPMRFSRFRLARCHDRRHGRAARLRTTEERIAGGVTAGKPHELTSTAMPSSNLHPSPGSSGCLRIP